MWTVLEFSPEDVIMAWQDQRLARLCFQAWVDAGKPEGFCIAQSAGEADVFTRWFVNEEAAALLDRNQIDWRRFAVTTADPPKFATVAIGHKIP